MGERKSKKWVVIISFIFLLTTGACLVLWSSYRGYCKKKAELGELNVQLNDSREELAELNAEVSGLKNSPEAVEKVAREKFGLVGDDESVIQYQLPEKAK